MPPRDRSHLFDILEALNSIRAFITGVDYDSFVENDMLLSAVIRKLEIVGEATKRLSSEFRSAHPEVPWKMMSGMNDILIHDYDQVDVELVWKTVSFETDKTKRMIEELVSGGDQDDRSIS
ncbi:MAG TPA: DUF86 domain-containing protein, partial [Candidatus Coatesbacteria bacterium]|nr:DUF86 domain-containing protein [Candidatus Coatesbacteria bacterium]